MTTTAAEQIALQGDALPDEFVSEFNRLSREHGIPPLVLEGERVMHLSTGWWLLVRVSGRPYVLTCKPSLERAARDLVSHLRGWDGSTL